MTNYAKFTENNDHEGESWRFWIPIEGNEDALQRLRSALDAADSDEEFELDLTPAPEVEVDALVKHTGFGWTAYDSKLEGVLTLPDDVMAEIENGAADEHLYKGGIKDLMVTA